MMSVYSLVLARKGPVIGIPSPGIKNCKLLNKTPPGLLLVWTVPVVSDKPCSVIVGGRGVNLYFYRLGTATNVFSMEDTDN